MKEKNLIFEKQAWYLKNKLDFRKNNRIFSPQGTHGFPQQVSSNLALPFGQL